MPKRKPILLILDSDADYVDIIKGKLESMGWSVKRVKNLELAKKELMKSVKSKSASGVKQTVVFLLDPHLEIHPEEILSEFIKNQEYQYPKLIIHTKNCSRKDIQVFKQIGIHDFWIKGHLSLSELLRHIKKNI